MKFVIFSPSLRRSAIGWCSASVTAELIRTGNEVRVVGTEEAPPAGEPLHDFGHEVLSWRDAKEVRQAVDTADGIFYQIGNNFEFHAGALAWLQEQSGIVILHDFFLGHLFWRWSERRRDTATAWLRNWYGNEVAETYFRINDSGRFVEETLATAPMTEWVSSMAQAVITHSSWGVERVLRSCAGPVRVVPLPYDKPVAVASQPIVESDSEDFEILTIGHVNPNKRVESVIAAIAESPTLLARATYRVVGAVHPEMRSRVESIARDRGVRLIVMGEVDDAELEAAVRRADVVSCLRWPCLEAASASLVEALLWGKPTVVTDAGFYRDIPDDCVIKIRHDDEIAELRSALEAVCTDPGRRDRLARKGREWAARTFVTSGYAREMVEIAADASRATPFLRAASDLATVLRSWCRSGPVPGMDEISAPLAIFGSDHADGMD